MSSTPPLRRSDRTKAALCAAAADCFRESGYQSSTTSKIAARAGVSEGTLFLHFTNKLGLLTVITEDFYTRLQATGENIVDEDGPVDERFHSLVASWCESMGKNWDFIQVFLQVSQSHPGSEFADLVAASNRRYSKLFTSLIDLLKASGGLPIAAPTPLIRDMILGALEHTARRQEQMGVPVDVTDTGRQCIDLLLTPKGTARTNQRPARTGRSTTAAQQSADSMPDRAADDSAAAATQSSATVEPADAVEADRFDRIEAKLDALVETVKAFRLER